MLGLRVLVCRECNWCRELKGESDNDTAAPEVGDSTNSARRSSINGSMISETKLCVAKPQEVVTTVKRAPNQK